MRMSFAAGRERGLTQVELLVVIVVICASAAIFLVIPDGNHKARALRLQCVNNLKQAGIACRIWPPAADGSYPTGLSTNHGGTMEFGSGPNAFRHFLIMSNELMTPKVLVCPADTERVQATAFNLKPLTGQIPFASNSNLSYFVGLEAEETDPRRLLAGDRNVTNGTPLKNGVLELMPNHPPGWTDEIHRKMGNVLFADGSVQLDSTVGLNSALTKTPAFTNRLLMPVLRP